MSAALCTVLLVWLHAAHSKAMMTTCPKRGIVVGRIRVVPCSPHSMHRLSTASASPSFAVSVGNPPPRTPTLLSSPPPPPLGARRPCSTGTTPPPPRSMRRPRPGSAARAQMGSRLEHHPLSAVFGCAVSAVAVYSHSPAAHTRGAARWRIDTQRWLTAGGWNHRPRRVDDRPSIITIGGSESTPKHAELQRCGCAVLLNLACNHGCKCAPGWGAWLSASVGCDFRTALSR